MSLIVSDPGAPFAAKRRFHIYVDESSQNGHRFMVLGALLIDESLSKVADARLEKVKHQRSLGQELKWGKISASKLDDYKAYIGAGMDMLRRNAPGFYAIVIDTSLLDHHGYNGGDQEIGFSKFVYQILMKCAKLFSNDATAFDCFLDDRVTKQTLDDLRDILNNGASKKFERRPYRRVEYRDSKRSNLIQFVDLMTGAIAYHCNDRQTARDASPARVAVAEMIASKAGLRSLATDTGPGRAPFSIWRFNASPRRAPTRA